MTKKIITILLALAMLLSMTACSQDSTSEPTKNSSSASDSSYLDSDYENSSESDADSSSENSTDDSSTVTSETTSTTSDTTTTTKNSTTTTTTKAQATTTTKQAVATTKATVKAVQSTKATVKVTAKPTTKATVKTTPKQSNNSNVKPSGLTRLEDAVWELSFHGKDTNTTYLNIVRDELIKYGQAYCKSNPACFKLFTINPKLYPYYDKNGKPLYAGCDMKGNVISVGSNVEFPYDEIDAPFNYSTSQERLQGCRSFINRMKLLIERVLCNALNHGIANMEWYITYGFEAAGTDWVVMAHIPDGKWVEFN